MSRETVGYVKLEWTCPNCGKRNPGPQKSCSGCGTPQPENVKFEEAAADNLITDQAEIDKAKAGADIHCAFCGARNPAGTAICIQCGADLKEGKQRVSGEVVGAFRTPAASVQIVCPNCGTDNPVNNLICSKCGAPLKKQTAVTPPMIAQKNPGLTKWILIGAGGVALLCILAFIFFGFLRRSDVVATVQDTNWTRSINIEQFGPVSEENWRKEIPANAKIGSCEKRYSHMSDQPVAGAEKICGTPFKIDQGNGNAAVVQDCQYKVSEDFCAYTIDKWKIVDKSVLQGQGQDPSWPQPSLSQEQRLGERVEQYKVVFATDKGQKEFDTNDFNLYSQCTVGSRWTLVVNGLGAIVSIEPQN